MQRRDILFLIGLIEMGKGQQTCCYQQTDTHYHSTDMLIGIEGFYAILETQTHNTHRYHGDDDVKGVLGLIVPLELEQALQYP